MRQAPEIVALYALNVSPSSIRIKIRQDFEKNRNIQDLQIIDMLLHKNQQEYQETMNYWKQEVRFATAFTLSLLGWIKARVHTRGACVWGWSRS